MLGRFSEILHQANFIALKADPNTKMVISGGNISGKTSTNFYGDVEIKGGDVVFNGAILVMSHKNTNGKEFAGKLAITGGTVTSSGNIWAYNGASGGQTSLVPYVSITGGNVSVNTVQCVRYDAAKNQNLLINAKVANAKISTGTFNVCPASSIIAEKFIAVKNSQGKIVIEEKPSNITNVDSSYKGETVAQVGGTVFGTIKNAIDAVAKATTEDKTPEVVIPVPKTQSVSGASIVLNKAAAQKVSSANVSSIDVSIAKNSEVSTTNSEAFDINIKSADTNLLPIGSGNDIAITVKIPCTTKSYKYVYYVDGQNHTLVDKVEYDGDYAVFTTNHLSTYKMSADVLDANGNVYVAPAPTPEPSIPVAQPEAPVAAPADSAAPAAPAQRRAITALEQVAPAAETAPADDATPAPQNADDNATAANAQAKATKDEETKKSEEQIADNETPLAGNESQTASEFPVLPVVGGGLLAVIASAVVFIRRRATN